MKSIDVSWNFFFYHSTTFKSLNFCRNLQLHKLFKFTGMSMLFFRIRSNIIIIIFIRKDQMPFPNVFKVISFFLCIQHQKKHLHKKNIEQTQQNKLKVKFSLSPQCMYIYESMNARFKCKNCLSFHFLLHVSVCILLIYTFTIRDSFEKV